jgi:hypothetical protein
MRILTTIGALVAMTPGVRDMSSGPVCARLLTVHHHACGFVDCGTS